MTYDNIKISASILSANFLHLEKDIIAVDTGGVDSLHLDIMDNHMAPSLSFGPPVIKPIHTITNLPMDVHLMIDSPRLFFDHYITHNVRHISFHIEAYDTTPVEQSTILVQSRQATHINYSKLQNDIQYLRSKNVLPCIAINPNTPPSILSPIISEIPAILVMSVHPGFSGQSFISSTFQKIESIRSNFSGDIRVDGGVNNTNAQQLIQSGATTLISASYLFNAENVGEAINSLRP
jgi:ribulose-phosphate 3-epimerase